MDSYVWGCGGEGCVYPFLTLSKEYMERDYGWVYTGLRYVGVDVSEANGEEEYEGGKEEELTCVAVTYVHQPTIYPI